MTSTRRSVVAVALAVFVLAALGSGAGTYALWTDSEPTDTETIRLSTDNQQTVSFGMKCEQAEVYVDDPSNYEFTAFAENGDSRVFDDPGAVQGNDKVKFQVGDISERAAQIDYIRENGTTFYC